MNKLGRLLERWVNSLFATIHSFVGSWKFYLDDDMALGDINQAAQLAYCTNTLHFTGDSYPGISTVQNDEKLTKTLPNVNDFRSDHTVCKYRDYLKQSAVKETVTRMYIINRDYTGNKGRVSFVHC